jgi:hypothetical protein
MRRFVIVVLSLLGIGFIFEPGVANAEPGNWADVPGYTGAVSSGQPAGTLISSTEVSTPANVKVPSRTYVLEFEDGTGQITKEVMIVPIASYEGVRPIYTHVVATDSLDPAKAPSKQLFKSDAGIDMSMTNEWLEGGGSVLIPDSYGDQNPEYAGVNNGIRIRNGMLASQQFVGTNAPIVCGGFSGGGLDCGRVAENKSVNVPNYSGTIISGAPANMLSVVTDALGREQSGLISTAAMPGVYRSLSDDEKAALDPKIRPSAKVMFDILNLGGAGSNYATYLGLVGIRADWLFTPGSFNDPEVQSVIARSGLGNSTPDAPVLVAGNQGDPWMIWNNNGKVLAERYAGNGANVSVLATDQQGWPGHKDIGAAQQIAWLNGQLPQGSKLIETNVDSAPVNPVLVALAPIQVAVTNAVGSAVATVVPQISAALDTVVPQVLDVVDVVVSAPKPQVPSTLVVDEPVNNVAAISEAIESHVGVENAPVVDQIIETVAANNPQVVDFINGLPKFHLPVG